MKIAVLIPSSTTHPQLGYDFYLSLQYALAQCDIVVEWMSASIGFGVDDVDMLAKAEDLLLNKGADLLVAFADYPKISKLFPLLEAVNKELVVVNMGAKLPLDWHPHPLVFHLSLQESLLAYVTGKTIYEEGSKQLVLASNYYEGGYAPCQLVVDAFMQEGGEIIYNFIPHSKGEAFSLEPLTTYLTESKNNLTIFASYSNPLTTVFWQQWSQQCFSQEHGLWGSSTFLMESLVTHRDVLIHNNHTSGFIAWDRALDNEENTLFLRVFEQKLNRVASCFAALGWDAGLLIAKALQDKQGNSSFSLIASMADLAGPIRLTRGEAIVDKDFLTLIAPVYRLSVIDKKIQYQTIAAMEMLSVWQDLKAQHPQPNQNGWFNTYLCS